MLMSHDTSCLRHACLTYNVEIGKHCQRHTAADLLVMYIATYVAPRS